MPRRYPEYSPYRGIGEADRMPLPLRYLGERDRISRILMTHRIPQEEVNTLFIRVSPVSSSTEPEGSTPQCRVGNINPNEWAIDEIRAASGEVWGPKGRYERGTPTHPCQVVWYSKYMGYIVEVKKYDCVERYALLPLHTLSSHLGGMSANPDIISPEIQKMVDRLLKMAKALNCCGFAFYMEPGFFPKKDDIAQRLEMLYFRLQGFLQLLLKPQRGHELSELLLRAYPLPSEDT